MLERDTSLWTIQGAPAGSPVNQGNFVVTDVPIVVAALVTTEDSVLVGYGIEQLATPADQADFVGRIMQYLLSLPGRAGRAPARPARHGSGGGEAMTRGLERPRQ